LLKIFNNFTVILCIVAKYSSRITAVLMVTTTLVLEKRPF